MLVPSQVGSRDTSRSTTVARKWHPFPPAIDRDQRHPRRTQLTRELRPTTAWSKTITHGQVFTCNHASCFCYPISSAATHPAEFSDTAFCIGIALLLRIGPVGLHFFHSTTTILQHQAFIQNGMPSPARAPVGSVQPRRKFYGPSGAPAFNPRPSLLASPAGGSSRRRSLTT
jgi:hypothetical protein